MNTINERIQIVVNKLFNGNVSELCRLSDISTGTMSGILGERKSKPSFENIEKIYSSIEEKINLDWLLTGGGEMLKSNSTVNQSGSGKHISITSGNSGHIGNINTNTSNLTKDEIVGLMNKMSIEYYNSIQERFAYLKEKEEVIKQKEEVIREKNDVIKWKNEKIDTLIREMSEARKIVADLIDTNKKMINKLTN
jgi:hypothetical protein